MQIKVLWPFVGNSPQPKYKKMKKLPTFIRDGGRFDILNVPMSFYQRISLVKMCRKLLESQENLQTIMACDARREYLQICHGLIEILTTDFRRKINRKQIENCYAAHEKNLKQETEEDDDDSFDMYQFATACGLITLCFLFAAALPESLFY